MRTKPISVRCHPNMIDDYVPQWCEGTNQWTLDSEPYLIVEPIWVIWPIYRVFLVIAYEGPHMVWDSSAGSLRGAMDKGENYAKRRNRYFPYHFTSERVRGCP